MKIAESCSLFININACPALSLEEIGRHLNAGTSTDADIPSQEMKRTNLVAMRSIELRQST